jgi:hypothetical protein
MLNCPIGNVIPSTPPGFVFAQGLLAIISPDYYVGVMVSWQPTVVKLYEYNPGMRSILVVQPIPVAFGQMGLLLYDIDILAIPLVPHFLTVLVAPESDDTITAIQFTVIAPDGSIHTSDSPFALTAFGLFRTFHSRPSQKVTHPSFRDHPAPLTIPSQDS